MHCWAESGGHASRDSLERVVQEGAIDSAPDWLRSKVACEAVTCNSDSLTTPNENGDHDIPLGFQASRADRVVMTKAGDSAGAAGTRGSHGREPWLLASMLVVPHASHWLQCLPSQRTYGAVGPPRDPCLSPWRPLGRPRHSTTGAPLVQLQACVETSR
jgi:hypothetical protein